MAGKKSSRLRKFLLQLRHFHLVVLDVSYDHPWFNVEDFDVLGRDDLHCKFVHAGRKFTADDARTKEG